MQANNGMPDWLASALGVGGGVGQATGGLFNLFGKHNNPADAANKTIGQIPGQTQPYYQPYMEAGKGALSDLQNQYKGLLGGDVQNQLGSSYKQSPGYQARLKDALTLGQNQSARGGFTGTSMDTENLMGIQDKLSSEDYNNYIKNQLGLYGLGLGGEEGLNNQGFNANKGMADTIGNVLGQQGAYNFMGQQGENQAKSHGLSDLFSGLGTAGASLFGGPAGSSAWQSLINLFGGGGKGA